MPNSRRELITAAGALVTGAAVAGIAKAQGHTTEAGGQVRLFPGFKAAKNRNLGRHDQWGVGRPGPTASAVARRAAVTGDVA